MRRKTGVELALSAYRLLDGNCQCPKGLVLTSDAACGRTLRRSSTLLDTDLDRFNAALLWFIPRLSVLPVFAPNNAS